MMQHEYSVAPADIHWFLGGLETPVERPLIPLDLPKSVKLDFPPDGDTLAAMFSERRTRRAPLDLCPALVLKSFAADSQAVSRLQGCREGLLPSHGNFPDHAYCRVARRRLSKASLGRAEPSFPSSQFSLSNQFSVYPRLCLFGGVFP
jgi:hypothetical protein